MMTATTRISTVPLFAGLRRSELRALDHLGVWLDLDGGRVLCREGEPGDEFFLLVDGTAGAQSTDGVVSILRAGTWFGEVALLTGASRCATVTTFTPSSVVVFDRREFEAMLRIAPTVRARLEQSAARLCSMSAPLASPDHARVDVPAGAEPRS